MICENRSLYPERASASDFKDTAAPRFGHIDVVFDIFIENTLPYTNFKTFVVFFGPKQFDFM